MMKRLLNKKGSVLFLVVVVMSILIVAASATFYIVNNQQSSVNVRYSSEQSYQTAVSVSDLIYDYINEFSKAIPKGTDIISLDNNIIKEMYGLSSNGKITTNTIDLGIDPAVINDLDLGSAEVTIEKYGKDKTDSNGNIEKHFVISTTSNCNGESVTIKQILKMVTGPTEYFTRFLTSTGKGRNDDVVVSAGEVLSDLYFENSYTRFGSNNAKLHNSVYVSGSYEEMGVVYDQNPDYYTEMVIGENLYLTSSGGDNIGTTCTFVQSDLNATEKSIASKYVYVGGDFYMNHTMATATYFIQGDCHIGTYGIGDSTFYVNKNLYIENGVNALNGTFYVVENVYVSTISGSSSAIKCGGKIYYNNSDSGISWSNTQISDSGVSGIFSQKMKDSFVDLKNTFSDKYSEFPVGDLNDWDSIDNYINRSTKKNAYPKWNAEIEFKKKYFNTNGTDITGKPIFTTPKESTTIIEISDKDDSHVTDYSGYGSYLTQIYDDCILQPNANQWDQRSVVEINATSKEIYIYLDSNGHMIDGQKCFTFGGNNTNVVIKGEYPVIFILPEDTNFKANDALFIGHVDLALVVCGKNDFESMLYDDKYVSFYDEGFRNIDTIKPLIHAQDEPDEDKEIGMDVGTINTTKISDLLGYETNVHNNIFFVTSGNKNYIDLSVNGVCICGYIYAPHGHMKCDLTYGGIGFIGGLIMGSYSYQSGTAGLVFSEPYDYNDNYNLSNKKDIVKHLIGLAGDSGDSISLPFQYMQKVGYLGIDD